MRFFSQSFLYDEPWSIVSLAYFLRYPNPHASHVISTDVVSRTITASGALMTTRLILKRGSLPRWAPEGIIPRSEAWVIEESEVDPYGKVVRCSSRNLDHVKVLSARESVLLKPTLDGKTVQRTDVSIVSGFGWGLTKRIEQYGLQKFKANIQKSREGLKVILELVRQSHPQGMIMGLPDGASASVASQPAKSFNEHEASRQREHNSGEQPSGGIWSRLPAWSRSRSG